MLGLGLKLCKLVIGKPTSLRQALHAAAYFHVDMTINDLDGLIVEGLDVRGDNP